MTKTRSIKLQIAEHPWYHIQLDPPDKFRDLRVGDEIQQGRGVPPPLIMAIDHKRSLVQISFDPEDQWTTKWLRTKTVST